MIRIDCEKDLERGDVGDEKIDYDEKRNELASQQTSPTLTEGTFGSGGDAKGMSWNH
jgi:hypothetical protein